MKSTLKDLLDKEAQKRNSPRELSASASPDPIWIAQKHQEEYAALVCALFAYGNARAIVRFLETFPFELLASPHEPTTESFTCKGYRFQTQEDVKQCIITLWRMRKTHSLNELFLEGYNKEGRVETGIANMLEVLYAANTYRSEGYLFLLGKPFEQTPKSPLKRWMMFVRWMVRHDAIDMGLWQGVQKKDLYIPLDTHTYKVAHALGLLKRKSYDFKAVQELTCNLRAFDANDPVKYDFALFRLGQEKAI